MSTRGQGRREGAVLGREAMRQCHQRHPSPGSATQDPCLHGVGNGLEGFTPTSCARRYPRTGSVWPPDFPNMSASTGTRRNAEAEGRRRVLPGVRGQCGRRGLPADELVTNAFEYAHPDGGGEVRIAVPQLTEGSCGRQGPTNAQGCPRTSRPRDREASVRASPRRAGAGSEAADLGMRRAGPPARRRFPRSSFIRG